VFLIYKIASTYITPFILAHRGLPDPSLEWSLLG